MSLTIEQTDAAIRKTFYNMKEGVEYVVNEFWFAESNKLRKEYGYSLTKKKQEYKLTRKGDQLFVNNIFAFDFAGKSNLAFALAFALQHNGIEKLNKDTCAGKVVEIDGKKYKLTLV